MRRALTLFLVVAAAAAQGVSPFQSAADVELGAVLYRNNCAVCHGLDGSGGRGPDLTVPVYRRATSDETLFNVIVGGVPGTEMPPVSLEGRQTWQVIAFLKSLRAVKATARQGADAERGRALFEGKGGCMGCHQISGRGGRIGPDLSTIGLTRPAGELETSMLRPDARVLPRDWRVRAVMRDGRAIEGSRLNEDTHSVQLLDDGGRLVSVLKAEAREVTIVKKSAMPSFAGKLDSQELADIVAYLASRRSAQ